MSARRTLIAIVLSAGLASPAWPEQPSSSSLYPLVLDLYRAGDTRAAFSNLSRLTSVQIASAKAALFREFDSAVPAKAVRAASSMRVAALLHTERAVAARAREDLPGWQYQIGVARAYVEKLASRDRNAPFPHTWWLTAIAYLQGQFDLPAAKEFGDWAHDSVGDSPELFLGIGATQEMGWTGQHEEGVDSPFKGDLTHAERAYRSALAGQPDLVEARLRLGRVLTLRGDTDAAARILAGIDERAGAAYQYLARMFEGDLFERRGDAAEAERRYLAATALLPNAQSAYVALAHVRYASGARPEAAANVRATTLDRSVPDTGDPWFWYGRGLSWRANGYLEDLRGMVRQ